MEKLIGYNNERVDKIIHKSVRKVNNLNTNLDECLYYDKYDSLILREKIYKDTCVAYEIWDNAYDKYGNITMSTYTHIIDNQVYASDDRTYYEYVYDKQNRIVEKKLLNREHKAYEMFRYFYNGNDLIKTEEYKLMNSKGVYGNSYPESYNFNHPYKTRYFTHSDKGQVKEEKVCLTSGDVSYYKIYDTDAAQYKILNPFQIGYAWTIEDIESGTFEISIKEDVFTADVLKNVVDTIINHYPECHWILLDLSNIKDKPTDNEKINEIMELYQKRNNIIFNYI